MTPFPTQFPYKDLFCIVRSMAPLTSTILFQKPFSSTSPIRRRETNSSFTNRPNVFVCHPWCCQKTGWNGGPTIDMPFSSLFKCAVELKHTSDWRKKGIERVNDFPYDRRDVQDVMIASPFSIHVNHTFSPTLKGHLYFATFMCFLPKI